MSFNKTRLIRRYMQTDDAYIIIKFISEYSKKLKQKLLQRLIVDDNMNIFIKFGNIADNFIERNFLI